MRLRLSFAFAIAVLGSLAGAQTLEGLTVKEYDLDNVEITKALTDFFTSMKVKALLSARVQGSVTLSLRNVGGEAALQNTLRQVNATYRVEHDIYEIVPKRDYGDAPFDAPELQDRTTFSSGDSVYILENDTLQKFRKADLKREGSVTLARSFTKKTFELSKEKERLDFVRTAHLANVDVFFAPQTQGTVTLPDGPATVADLNLALAQTFKKNYYIEDGDFVFFRPLSPYVSLRLVEMEPLPYVRPKASISSDAVFLYVTSGRWIYKVRKSNMKVVGTVEIQGATY